MASLPEAGVTLRRDSSLRTELCGVTGLPTATFYKQWSINRDTDERGILSLGKAAELAEFNLGVFIGFLDELEIPVIDYDNDELNAELKIAKKLKEA